MATPLIVNKDALIELFSQIQNGFNQLSDLLQDNPEAYKLCYELNGKVISYSESALILSERPKVMPPFN